MSALLNVSSNPHVRDHKTTARIMLDVIIALLPASGFGIYYFGMRALLIILSTIGACVVSEAVYDRLIKKPLTIRDGSAVVTGLLLALNLPVEIPVWIAVLGGIFAIIVVKMVFGGLGQNFMNPALGARCFLLLSFTGQMTRFTIDGVTTATPLYAMKNGADYSVWKMFLGTTAGTIGETSVIALLAGALYLVIMRIIDLRIPVCYIATFSLFALIYSACTGGVDLNFVAGQLCGGGLMLGAWYMATDYATSPITPMGRVIYGVCLGLFTGCFRLLATQSAAPEGVSYAIIFCNLLVPLIEKITIPKSFGKEKTVKESRQAGTVGKEAKKA